MNAYWLSLTKMKTHGAVLKKKWHGALTFGLYYRAERHSAPQQHRKNIQKASHWTVSEQTRAGLSARQLAMDQNHDPVRLPALPNTIAISVTHTCIQTHTLEHFLNAALVPNHWQSCKPRRHRDVPDSCQRSRPWPKNGLLERRKLTEPRYLCLAAGLRDQTEAWKASACRLRMQSPIHQPPQQQK